MSFGTKGSVSHTGTTADAKSSTTTPWTAIAGQLAQTLMGNLKSLGSGTSISEGVKAITASSERQTKEGIANIKEAYGKSGMRFSSDIGKNIADFQIGQTTALNTEIAQFQQQTVQNQLAALQEIIALGAGSSATTEHASSSSLTWGMEVSAATKPCWIAAVVFDGWFDPRTVKVRRWLLENFSKTLIGEVVVRLYLRFGERTARVIKRVPILKPPFKLLFNLALMKAEGDQNA